MPDVYKKLLQTNNEYRELWAKRNALVMQRDDLDRQLCENWDVLMAMEAQIKEKRIALTASMETN